MYTPSLLQKTSPKFFQHTNGNFYDHTNQISPNKIQKKIFILEQRKINLLIFKKNSCTPLPCCRKHHRNFSNTQIVIFMTIRSELAPIRDRKKYIFILEQRKINVLIFKKNSCIPLTCCRKYPPNCSNL